MALQLSRIGSSYICICTYKYLKEKTKRAQVKPKYGGKKKKKKKKKKRPINDADCQIIVKIL